MPRGGRRGTRVGPRCSCTGTRMARHRGCRRGHGSVTRTPAAGSPVSGMGIFLARLRAAAEKAGCEGTGCRRRLGSAEGCLWWERSRRTEAGSRGWDRCAGARSERQVRGAVAMDRPCNGARGRQRTRKRDRPPVHLKKIVHILFLMHKLFGLQNQKYLILELSILFKKKIISGCTRK